MKLTYFLSFLCMLFFINIVAVVADPFTTTMEEGQEENFTLGNTIYDIEVMIIEDATPATVTFSINGQITPQMIEHQSFVLQDSARIFINNITLNEAGEAGSGDTVTFTLFYCGDNLCDISESCLTCGSDCGCQLGYDCRAYNPPVCLLTVCGDNWCSPRETCERDSCCDGRITDFERDRNNCGACGNVCNDNMICISGLCQIEPPDQCSTNADCDDDNACTSDICEGRLPRICYHIPIPYCGIPYAAYGGYVRLEPRGDDEYTLEFSNRYDVAYRFPYITNEGSTFKYGDNNKDLVFIEANFSEDMTVEDAQRTENLFNVGILDYFVLSSMNDSTGDIGNATSHIVRYNSIDIYDRTLSFDEEGSGTQEFTYESLDLSNGAVIGKAYLRFGNNRYIVYIANATSSGNDNPLAIDMNGDSVINRAEIHFTNKALGIIDFGNADESDGGAFVFSGGQYTWSNTGEQIISASESPLTLLTKRGTIRHNKPHQDELVTTIIEQRNQNRLGIQSVTGSHFSLRHTLGENRKRTNYDILFTLFVPCCEDAETFTITYLRRDPRN